MSDSKRGYSKLIGFDRVVQHFGYWPTFHDAEVLSLTLDRDAQVGDTGPTLTLLVHGFEITSEVTQAGFLRTVKHCVVSFAFYDVWLERLEDFNHQNAIMGMNIADVSSNQIPHLRIAVAIDGANGLTCRFQCKYTQVMELRPSIPPGSQYSRKAE